MKADAGPGIVTGYLRALSKEECAFDPANYGICSPLWRTGILWFSDSWNLCLFLAGCPFIELMIRIVFGGLGANPIEAFHLFTGIWALRFLCVTLLVTPVQAVTRWRAMANFRQLFGLTSFFYAALHVYGYLWIDQGLVWPSIATDVVETGYIWYGIFAFAVLLLLALTSPKAAKKVLKKNWKRLHRWIYPASVAVVLHYWMQGKGNLAEPLFYAVWIGSMLLFRIMVGFKNRMIARLMIPQVARPGDVDDLAESARCDVKSLATNFAEHSDRTRIRNSGQISRSMD